MKISKRILKFKWIALFLFCFLVFSCEGEDDESMHESIVVLSSSDLSSDGRLGGIDWSPDSKDIIFQFDEFTVSNSEISEGIYRVNLNGGGPPSLLFSDGEDGSSAIEIAYYANGTRIAFEGHRLEMIYNLIFEVLMQMEVTYND